jgi:hypothetical protein
MSSRLFSVVTALFLMAGCANGGNSNSTPSPSPTRYAERTPAFTDAPDLSSPTRENPNPTTPPDERFNVTSINDSFQNLMAAYRKLHSRAQNIISEIADGQSNDAVLQNGGSQWYDNERSFQSQIDALPVNLNHLSQYLLVKGNLAEAEQFLYAAGSDAMGSCNAGNARKELKVADYFFAAVEHEMSVGSASTEDASSPPNVDSATNKCSK